MWSASPINYCFVCSIYHKDCVHFQVTAKLVASKMLKLHP